MNFDELKDLIEKAKHARDFARTGWVLYHSLLKPSTAQMDVAWKNEQAWQEARKKVMQWISEELEA